MAMKNLSHVAVALCLLTCSVRSQCSNTHDGAMLLSVSINGYSVDRIGRGEYLDVIDEAAAAIIQASGQTVGLQSFAGNGDATNHTIYFTDILPIITMPSGTTVSDAIQGLIFSDFDINYGNSVSKALDNAIDQFLTVASTSQKYHVLFSAGNPLQGQIGETTNAGDFDDPCSDARDAKNAHIQTYVALIGEQGLNFVKEYFSCLVEDPSSDIIIIDPTDSAAGIANLLDRVCKANGYDVRITEVNPTEDGTYQPFIEIHNRGASLTLKACWNSASDSSCSGSVTVDTGDFFVAACESCSGTDPGRDSDTLSAASSSTGWTAVAATGTTELDRVTHGSGDHWQTSQIERSFELRGVGFNNDYGANWRVSCNDVDGRIGGSPGAATAECEATDNSCSDLDACQDNGDDGRVLGRCSVASSNQWCECSDDYLGDVDTCIEMPAFYPSCTAYVIKDRLGVRYTHFAVEKPDWDGEVSYRMQYSTWTGVTTLAFFDGVNMGAVSNNNYFQTTTSITMRATYTALLSGTTSSVDTSMTCDVITPMPTASPTPSPTGEPTTEEPTPPSNAPTAVPTTTAPTDAPTTEPTTATPTNPSNAPTAVPTTMAPTDMPTTEPITAVPTVMPSMEPTINNVMEPTKEPSIFTDQSGATSSVAFSALMLIALQFLHALLFC